MTRARLIASLPLALTPLCGVAVAAGTRPAETPRLAALALPGTPAFVHVARDVIDVAVSVDPSRAARAGLFDDAAHAPSFSRTRVTALVKRLDHDLAELRKMPWRTWADDRQLDFRWIFACAETERRGLADEKMYLRRPAAWLDPISDTLIAFAAAGGGHKDLTARLLAQIPAVLGEIRAVAPKPTRRDIENADRLTGALIAMAERDGGADAKKKVLPALRAYRAELARMSPAVDFSVIGSQGYAWRLQRALLTRFIPADLGALAEKEIAHADGEIRALVATSRGHGRPADPAERERAAKLDETSRLALYDEIEAALRKVVATSFATLPDDLAVVHAREAPVALASRVGDGVLLTPAAAFGEDDAGWLNVAPPDAKASAADKLAEVVRARDWRENALGAEAAREGIPGRALQAAAARRAAAANPIRAILTDDSLTDGWAVYALDALWRGHELGDRPRTGMEAWRVYRRAAVRALEDVRVEDGTWTPQQAADYEAKSEPGEGVPTADILAAATARPDRLGAAFIGAVQLQRLREDYRKKVGAAFKEQAFHDAVLAEGAIPVALIRCKVLGEAVPSI